MPEAATYSTVLTLRDGRTIEIRALRPADRDDLMAAVGRTSGDSLYRRFFSPRRRFTETEVTFFVDVDFVNHVALVAVTQEGGRSVIIGTGRYIVVKPGQAEVAFAVMDDYQGRGIGSALVQHLVAIARGAGLQELIADVLPENIAMRKVFEKCGLPLTMRRDRGVVHIALRLCS